MTKPTASPDDDMFHMFVELLEEFNFPKVFGLVVVLPGICLELRGKNFILQYLNISKRNKNVSLKGGQRQDNYTKNDIRVPNECASSLCRKGRKA